MGESESSPMNVLPILIFVSMQVVMIALVIPRQSKTSLGVLKPFFRAPAYLPTRPF
jgi:hypothetical protein